MTYDIETLKGLYAGAKGNSCDKCGQYTMVYPPIRVGTG